MFDIHTHILPGIDDGASSAEETLEILKEAASIGINKIIFTPHYVEGNYETRKDIILELIDKLRKIIRLEKINIEIYPGNEIYAQEDIEKLFNENKIFSLNNSKYVLIEFPMNDEIISMDNIVLKIISLGYVPIIAHPERYKYIQKDPNKIYDLIQKGVLFQGNLGSIIGIYGKKEKETIIKLLKHNMIHFLASDVHKELSLYKKIETIGKDLNKIIDGRKIEELVKKNPNMIIENKNINIEEPIKIEKFSWH